MEEWFCGRNDDSAAGPPPGALLSGWGWSACLEHGVVAVSCALWCLLCLIHAAGRRRSSTPLPRRQQHRGYELVATAGGLGEAGLHGEVEPGSDIEVGAELPSDDGGADAVAAMPMPRTAAAVSALRDRARSDLRRQEGPVLRLVGFLLSAALSLGTAAALWRTAGMGDGDDDDGRTRAEGVHQTVALAQELIACCMLLVLLSCEACTGPQRAPPRSTMVLLFWGGRSVLATLRLAAPLVQMLRWRGLPQPQRPGFSAGSLSSSNTAAAAARYRPDPREWLGLGLGVVACATALAHRRSQLWRAYLQAWTMQSSTPPRPGSPQRRPTSKLWRLVRMARPDLWYIVCGMCGFVVHATAKLSYQLLYGQLIDAVYRSDREEVVGVLLAMLAASVAVVWADAAAGVYLDLGAARLARRLQTLTYNVPPPEHRQRRLLTGILD
eukprot:COSAG01_NODE_2213_length_8163_cov_18.627327_2_plen_439_part_00